MGLGKKLGQYNAVTEQNLQSARADISDRGYNASNVDALNEMPLNQREIDNIQESSREAIIDAQKYASNTHLKKPSVPVGPEYPSQDVSALVVDKMWRIICANKLHNFYTQERLQTFVNRACKHDYKILMNEWNIPTMDMTVDLAVLGLYDIIIYADDSGSMATEEPTEDNMTRWEVLKNLINTCGFWASLMDADGVVVRFINSNVEGNGIKTMNEIRGLFRNVRPNGGTPLGEKMQEKIIQPIIEPFIRNQQLDRPVLILTLTDGAPNNPEMVRNVIKSCYTSCKQSKYGEHAVAFSFAQIGSDRGATEYLSKLDSDREVGHLIDCTSEYTIEKNEILRAYPNAKFTEATWVIKTMIGAVDPDYDKSDEAPPSYSV
jgi:hypothetical protein